MFSFTGLIYLPDSIEKLTVPKYSFPFKLIRLDSLYVSGFILNEFPYVLI